MRNLCEMMRNRINAFRIDTDLKIQRAQKRVLRAFLFRVGNYPSRSI